jgi:hypothetical protein
MFASRAVMPGERYVVVYTDATAIGQTLLFNKPGAGYLWMSGRTPMYSYRRASSQWLARDTVGLISLKARE